ncbi:DUF397 domain-containing protein [Amycolatopsis aidingensis]|uniref:DUF397 domain-containing protein n=1 Tax=Amycolatopsis aidingensis TaxID=2842453 RepID=UPI001C0CBB3C|nr:DUF397 domain-containing protein [Amycolatopsis aidingensis]
MTISAADLPGAQWRKSSKSNGGGGAQCVMLTWLPTGGAIADSKNMTGPALRISTRALHGLLDSARTHH